MKTKITIEEAKEIMKNSDGNLDLSGTGITTLPDNLTVGGWIDLRDTGVNALPDDLTVGGWLDLGNTKITALPDNLTIGGSLDLRCTGITALPDNLTVGGWLDLRDTGITALPDSLTVGGSLFLRGTGITGNDKVKKLKNGDYVEGEYLYCDTVLTHVKKKKQIGEYTVYFGKIPHRNVVSDGKFYAHCDNIRDGIADLLFKKAKNRGADQYKGLSLDTEMTVSELVMMYRVITGACRQGSEDFVKSMEELKERYTIREAIEITDGQYNSERFARFFLE